MVTFRSNNNRRPSFRSNNNRRPQFRRNNDEGLKFHNNDNFHRKAHDRNNFNAAKLIEKYNDLAREASSNGDKILSENYMQHADHFTRILNEQENLRKERLVENKAVNLEISLSNENTVNGTKEERSDNNGSTSDIKKNEKSQSEAS